VTRAAATPRADAPEPGGLVCGCCIGPSTSELPRLLRQIGLDMIELRLDTFSRQSLEEASGPFAYLASPGRLPAIATNRPVREGGAFEGPEKDRFNALLRAARAGAEWIDVEAGTPAEIMESLRGFGSKILVSHHDFEKTPSVGELGKIVEQLCRSGADAVKIATQAASQADNLVVLGLIPFAKKEFGKELVAFCMGTAGRWSRVACLLLGSPWTYVRLHAEAPAQWGQLSREELRAALDIFGYQRPEPVAIRG
jgi:3-dehydroquinate dehydratase I